jgi:hypothetical protein
MAESLQPLIVSVRQARQLLGGASNNRFWDIVRTGALELLGNERKRWVTVASIENYIKQQVAIAAAAPRRRGRPHQNRQPNASTTG